jgi:hypothetical protein
MEDIERIEVSSTISTVVDREERLRGLRAGLPGQVRCERIEAARLGYGPLYRREEVERRVGETLPQRLGFRRVAVFDPIETYAERIPDHALLAYGEAAESGLFSQFWVATPAYRSERQADPWILGEVKGADLYAVIARWD